MIHITILIQIYSILNSKVHFFAVQTFQVAISVNTLYPRDTRMGRHRSLTEVTLQNDWAFRRYFEG